MKLIIESGASKTDWVFIKRGKIVTHFQTHGMNPIAGFNPESIKELVLQKTSTFHPDELRNIFFYGAGCINEKTNSLISDFLTELFGAGVKIEVNNDVLAAARALSPDQKAVIGIIGTGSIAAVFDGNKITYKTNSLGYLVSDEGSGYDLGKAVLKHLTNNLSLEMEDVRVKLNLEKPEDLMTRLGKTDAPNREVAKYALILKEMEDSELAESILNNAFNNYFQWHILRIPEFQKYPLLFSGSIAYYFQETLTKVAHSYDLRILNIVKSPLDGLIKYHG